MTATEARALMPKEPILDKQILESIYNSIKTTAMTGGSELLIPVMPAIVTQLTKDGFKCKTTTSDLYSVTW